jgi:hypothetical protein
MASNTGDSDMTTTRPTWRSTLETYDITPRLYRQWDTELLQSLLARYRAGLEHSTSEAGRAVSELRISQLERELSRRQ